MNSIKSGNVDKTKDIGRGMILTPNSIENFKAQGSSLVKENKSNIIEGRQTVNSLENLNENLDSLEQTKKAEPELVVSENYERDLYIAVDKNASEEDLLMASRNENADIRHIVATNPNTPGWLLDELAKDEDTNVLSGVVSNPNTEDRALELLSESESEYIRAQVALHPNTDYNVLNNLITDPSEYVRSCVAENPSTEESNDSGMFDLCRDESDMVRESVIKNIGVDGDMLSVIAEGDPNPAIALKAQRLLEKADQAYTSDNAALLTRLSADEHRIVAIELGQNKHTPAEGIANLAKNPNSFVRTLAAEHPNASAQTLELLSQDKDYSVVSIAVAKSPNTSIATLVELSNRPRLELGLVKNLLSNPNTPAPVFEKLSKHELPYVRAVVAEKTSNPEMLAHLMNDKDKNVRTKAFYNANMPAPELHEAPKEWVEAVLGENSVNLNDISNQEYFAQKNK